MATAGKETAAAAASGKRRAAALVKGDEEQEERRHCFVVGVACFFLIEKRTGHCERLSLGVSSA